MFEHFLITRFNLKLDSIEELSKFPNEFVFLNSNNQLSKPNIRFNEKDWIEWTQERFGIFNEYTLPSVLQQESAEFKWLIYFDVETPSVFTESIEKIKRANNVHILYAKGVKGFHEQYIEDIYRLSEHKEWIITTRLDNDDCLEKQAIRTINSMFNHQENIISMASGYKYNYDNHELAHSYWPNGPFISIVEKINNGKIKGVFHKPHGRYRETKINWNNLLKRKKASFIFDKPLWLVVCHGKNVYNDFYTGFPVLSKKDLSGFGLSQDSKSSSLTNITKFANYVIWKRHLFSLITRFLKLYIK
ncbi:hypothetical protein D1614_02910 [Maribellus luteus]|uniref:Uncharacterized protein n=1 Tax=Maribellus luteus TaxID=2305463 RepID=A0A399T6A9_9BACT|nr:glycosyltransferase [Maribellus luteus]RIJ49707.1 hypothetical protein D1614_02910 [Maribellus luteus]